MVPPILRDWYGVLPQLANACAKAEGCCSTSIGALPWKLWRVNTAIDSSLFLAQAKEQLGLSTVLIRPDAFVAWASGNVNLPTSGSVHQSFAAVCGHPIN